jgi:hypothetical protein
MQLPGPVRAVVGLLATAADEAKHLPDRAIELPMLAVSSALQMSLRAQQRYARLAARGDDVINRRPPGTEPPAWATFDDPVSADEVRAATLGGPDSARQARAATQLLDELLGTATPAQEAAAEADEPAPVTQLPTRPAKKAVAKRAPAQPARKPSSEKAVVKAVPAAKKVVAKTTSAKTTSAKTTTAKTAAAKTPPAKKTAARKAAAERSAGKGKTINRPRHANPSRFDTVGDD